MAVRLANKLKVRAGGTQNVRDLSAEKITHFIAHLHTRRRETDTAIGPDEKVPRCTDPVDRLEISQSRPPRLGAIQLRKHVGQRPVPSAGMFVHRHEGAEANSLLARWSVKKVNLSLVGNDGPREGCEVGFIAMPRIPRVGVHALLLVEVLEPGGTLRWKGRVVMAPVNITRRHLLDARNALAVQDQLPPVIRPGLVHWGGLPSRIDRLVQGSRRSSLTCILASGFVWHCVLQSIAHEGIPSSRWAGNAAVSMSSVPSRLMKAFVVCA